MKTPPMRHLVPLSSRLAVCGKRYEFYVDRYCTRLVSEATCPLCVLGSYANRGATPEQARADYERMLRTVRP